MSSERAPCIAEHAPSPPPGPLPRGACTRVARTRCGSRPAGWRPATRTGLARGRAFGLFRGAPARCRTRVRRSRIAKGWRIVHAVAWPHSVVARIRLRARAHLRPGAVVVSIAASAEGQAQRCQYCQCKDRSSHISSGTLKWSGWRRSDRSADVEQPASQTIYFRKPCHPATSGKPRKGRRTRPRPGRVRHTSDALALHAARNVVGWLIDRAMRRIYLRSHCATPALAATRLSLASH
jgi:hypothetical protein